MLAVRILQSLILAIAFVLPALTFKSEAIWTSAGGALVTAGCIVAGLALAGLIGLLTGVDRR